jgi:hypothetical protein
MVTVLGGSGTATTEARLHFALAGGPCHAFTSLLPAESPDRVAASDVPGADDSSGDGQCDDNQARQASGRQDDVRIPRRVATPSQQNPGQTHGLGRAGSGFRHDMQPNGQRCGVPKVTAVTGHCRRTCGTTCGTARLRRPPRSLAAGECPTLSVPGPRKSDSGRRCFGISDQAIPCQRPQGSGQRALPRFTVPGGVRNWNGRLKPERRPTS